MNIWLQCMFYDRVHFGHITYSVAAHCDSFPVFQYPILIYHKCDDCALFHHNCCIWIVLDLNFPLKLSNNVSGALPPRSYCSKTLLLHTVKDNHREYKKNSAQYVGHAISYRHFKTWTSQWKCMLMVTVISRVISFQFPI